MCDTERLPNVDKAVVILNNQTILNRHEAWPETVKQPGLLTRWQEIQIWDTYSREMYFTFSKKGAKALRKASVTVLIGE